jgi:hypothetical protein
LRAVNFNERPFKHGCPQYARQTKRSCQIIVWGVVPWEGVPDSTFMRFKTHSGLHQSCVRTELNEKSTI